VAEAAAVAGIRRRRPEDVLRTRGLPGRAHRPLSTP
jgi:hypothetical protein